MDRCSVKIPRVTVVLTVQHAEDTLQRAIQSVLSQSLTELQLVLCAHSSAKTAVDACERAAERDIRVDALALEEGTRAQARDGALALARAPYVLFIDAREWLAPGMLAALMAHAEQNDLDFVLPTRLIDTYDAQGACSTLPIEPMLAAAASGNLLCDAVLDLVESDALECADALLYRRSIIQEQGLLFAKLAGDFEFNTRFLVHAQHVGACNAAACHMPRPADASTQASQMFDACLATQESLEALLEHVSAGSDRAMLVAERRFFRRVVSCIEYTCSSEGRLNPSERSARVRAMLNAPKTVSTASALKPCSRELGFMYNAIARRNTAACCMAAWVSNLVHTTQRLGLYS